MLVIILVPVVGPGLLKAEESLNPSAREDFPVISAEELALKPLLDTGWGNFGGGRCARVLINDSDFLLCVPAETRDDCLMVPLEQFCLIAGCGLETGPDGKPRLLKYDTYHLEADPPALTRGDESWPLAVAPYEAHGFLYVPLRSLSEALGVKIKWHAESDVVLIRSLGVSAGAVYTPLTALNERLSAALRNEEWPFCLEQMEITVTFYSSKRNPPYTASGAIATAGSIAADSGIPFGAQFYIPILEPLREDCIFTVHDRGRKVKGDLIDVFIPNELRSDPLVNVLYRRGRFSTTAYLIPAE